MPTYGNRPWVDSGFAGGTRLGPAGPCKTFSAYKAAGGTLSPIDWLGAVEDEALNRFSSPGSPPRDTGGRSLHSPQRWLDEEPPNKT